MTGSKACMKSGSGSGTERRERKGLAESAKENMSKTTMSDSTFTPLAASCDCGTHRILVKARPFARFICHCEICQAYTGQPFSDVTVLRARDVDMSAARSVVYRKYRLPPNIERGSCASCGKPVIEFGLAGPARLAFVPSGNYADASTLAPASLHMFYHRRVSDAHDDLPRHSGYFASQLAVLRLLFRGLTAKKSTP
jgi:hypothetical protein